MMSLRRRANTTPPPFPPRPLVLTPSGLYDGDDGKWSTFTINIAGDGNGKGQNFRVLISTSSPITLVPGQTGWCDTEECAERRGVEGDQALGLDMTTSDTYSFIGLYDLPILNSFWYSRDLLLPSSNSSNSAVNGQWGVTNVGLGAASNQSQTMADQYVAVAYLEDFFLGSLGLSMDSISAAGTTKRSFFAALADAGDSPIASHSYGFTAGASYRNGNRGTVGNMVFGGYDNSRVNIKRGVSVSMPSQQNNTLLVGVNSIVYTPDPDVQQGATSLTTKGFSAVIDSTFPYLVLPSDVCDKFVAKFNLAFDRSTGLYTINSTAHEQNMQQNATVRLVISSDPGTSSPSSTIDFPYAAFYLEASDPIYPNTTNYFPIRKSSNGINILGRSFLQEAYIVVDYERANFTVAPAAVFSTLPAEDLVTIFNTTYKLLTHTQDSGKGGLAAGAIAGIVIGIIAAFLLLGGGAFFYFKRRRTARANRLAQEGKPPGVDTISAGGEIKYRRESELAGSEPAYSPQTKPADFYGGNHKSIAELSPESHPAELYSPPLDGSENDYFAGAPKPRRRGATRDSTGNNTPGTPIAELAGDEGRYHVSGQHFDAISPLRPKHNRGPSDNSLSTGIDEVLAGPDSDAEVQRRHSSKFLEHTGDETARSRAEMVVSPLENTRTDETEATVQHSTERRPSHTRGLSDTTIASDSTAVSQPTPDELESWARSGNDAPNRPASR